MACAGLEWDAVDGTVNALSLSMDSLELAKKNRAARLNWDKLQPDRRGWGLSRRKGIRDSLRFMRSKIDHSY